METADSVTFHKCVCRHMVFRGLWCVADGPPADPADPTDSAGSLRARRTGPEAAACLAEGPGTGHAVRMSRAAYGANLGNATGTGPDRTRTEPNRTRQGQNGPEPNHKERKEPQ